MNRIPLPKLLSIIFGCLAVTLTAGCATEQQLGRAYGVLEDKIDVSQKGMSSLLEKRAEETRQMTFAETAALSKEMQNLKAQTQLDIEINRKEIQAAATRAELKRVEEGSLQQAESLEKKIMSALEGRVRTLRSEISEDRIKQAALANQIVELTTEMRKYRADMEKSGFQITQELQRSKETFIADFQKARAEIDAARENIDKNITQTERSRREIEQAAQELEKHKADITKLREAIEVSRQELSENRLQIEKNITETERHKTDMQLATLGIANSRSELERIKNEIDKDRLEIKNLSVEIQTNRALLDENRILIQKGQTDLDRVGKDMMLSKSVGADMVADMTDLRDKQLQLAGSLEGFQRNQAITDKEQQALQSTVKGMIESERRAASQQAALAEKLNQLSKNIEFLTRYLDLDKKEPPAASAAQPSIVPTAKDPPSLAATTENVPLEILYERAYDAFKEGKYAKARSEFQELLKKFPRGELSENAQFWIAESYFFEKQFERAIVEYEKTLKDHAGGHRTPQALLRQGLSFLSLGDKMQARLYFEKVRDDFPHSTQARLARSRLAEMN